MLIRGLWEIQTDVIVETIFVDADVESYVKEGMDIIFPRWEQTKKENQIQHYNTRHKQIPMFVLSLDGILDKEVQVVLATLS